MGPKKGTRILIRVVKLLCLSIYGALSYILDNIYIRLGNKLYNQTCVIAMGTNSASLVADLFSFCYVRNFVTTISKDN